MRRRASFVGAATTLGLRWARGVLTNTLLAFGVLALAVGVGVSGVLVGQPAWFIGGLASVTFVVVLGEGAYRVWDEADLKAMTAIGKLEAEHSSEAVAARLDGLAREWELLKAEVPSYWGPDALANQGAWEGSSEHLAEMVRSELRRHAPGFMAYWMTNPEPIPEDATYSVRSAMLADMSFDQLRYIAQRIRAGHDSP